MSTHQHGMDKAAVLGLGLCTPLGLTARATQVEIAAGTVRFFETDVVDGSGEPVRASVLTLLEPGLTRTERMVALAVTAFQEAIPRLASLEIERLPLLLALPEPSSGAPFDLEAVRQALANASAPVQLEISEIIEGRAGFFRALKDASQLLKLRKTRWVLVGGVDSMCDRGSLNHHAQTGRSLGPSTRDGILPGEGAGFLLLTSTSLSRQQWTSPQGWIIGCALSHEPRSFLQKKPNLAEGLSDAFRQLWQHPAAGGRRVDAVFSCQTGELFWAREFSHAYLRNSDLMPEPLTVSMIAKSLGDTGAAAGAILLGNALHRLQKRTSPDLEASRLLLYGCSDAGQIGACIIEADG